MRALDGFTPRRSSRIVFQLAWPWVLGALPLPFLVRRLMPPARDAHPMALRIPFFGAATAWREAGRPVVPSRKRGIVLWIAWIALVAGGARPQWLGEPLSLPVTGRDIVLAIDLSGSMDKQDQVLSDRLVDRLGAVKTIAGEFIERRLGDRVGLVLFGSRPYVQVPLTFDRKMTSALLQEAIVGIAGGQTAIGDAIGLSVRMLRERPADSRVLVLLTDGENTHGRLDPLDAARLARLHDLRIHTIGFGSEVELAGNPTLDRLDEQLLRDVSRITGGSYFRARDSRGLAAIYRLVDEIEPAADESDIVRPPDELFHWPLGLAYALAILAGVTVLARDGASRRRARGR